MQILKKLSLNTCYSQSDQKFYLRIEMQILDNTPLYTNVMAKLDNNCYFKCKYLRNYHFVHNVWENWT